MSENKEQTTKEFLKELGTGDYSNLWELNDTLQSEHPDDKAPFLKIFNEDQLGLLKIIVNHCVTALEFHSKKDDEAHPDLREKVENIDAKLRNHRHDTTKQYSAKPEF